MVKLDNVTEGVLDVINDNKFSQTGAFKIGQAVWANLGSFTKVCPQPRNDDTNGSLFGNIEQPPKKRQSENGGVSCCTMKICTKKNNI